MKVVGLMGSERLRTSAEDLSEPGLPYAWPTPHAGLQPDPQSSQGRLSTATHRSAAESRRALAYAPGVQQMRAHLEGQLTLVADNRPNKARSNIRRSYSGGVARITGTIRGSLDQRDFTKFIETETNKFPRSVKEAFFDVVHIDRATGQRSEAYGHILHNGKNGWWLMDFVFSPPGS